MQASKHPNYDTFDELDAYVKRCHDNDPTGFELVFVFEDGIEKIIELDEYLKRLHKLEKGIEKLCQKEITADVAEENDRKTDPTRKFQFEYDRSVCIVETYPEACLNEDQEGTSLSFAPGEGKVHKISY